MSIWQIYIWTIIGGTLAASALSLVGAQLAARNQSVQALVVSQGAGLGVILALALKSGNSEPHSHIADFLPLILGSVGSFAAFILCEGIVQRRWPSRNTYFIALFSLLMAISYALVAMIPTLETHMAASYFGDLTLATEHEQILISFIALAALVFLLKKWRQISSWSFDQMTFGSFVATRSEMQAQLGFVATSMILISASVHFLGLLFTLTALFIPSVLLVRSQHHMKGLALKLLISSATGALAGISFSLIEGHIPTVPAIAITLVVCSLLVSRFPVQFLK